MPQHLRIAGGKRRIRRRTRAEDVQLGRGRQAELPLHVVRIGLARGPHRAGARPESAHVRVIEGDRVVENRRIDPGQCGERRAGTREQFVAQVANGTFQHHQRLGALIPDAHPSRCLRQACGREFRYIAAVMARR